MRRRRSEDSDGLDSLVDTVTNVVGMLVLFLGVSQLTVGAAVDRVRHPPSVGPSITKTNADIAEQQHRVQQDEIAEAQSTVDALPGLEARLAGAHGEIQRLQKAITGEAIAGQRRQREFQNEIGKALGGTGATPDRAVRLPDPRAAPVGAARVEFACREGRVAHLDTALLLQRHRQGLGDSADARGFRLVERIEGGRRLLLLEPGSNAVGETRTEIAQPGSEFLRVLNGLTRERHYVRFLVWNDSFAVYHEARRIVESAGVSVGWMALNRGETLVFGAGSATPERSMEGRELD